MDHIATLSNEDLKDLGNQGFTLALRLLSHREDAADAVQDAMHQLFRKHASFDSGRGSLKSWFLRIVKNRCMDMRRKAQPVSAGSDFDPLDRSSGLPQDNLVKKEGVDIVRDALNQLSEESREILLLRDFHGLRYAEIADVLGISPGTVMSRLHRSREKLREQISHTGGRDKHVQL
ncbi:RNA polymerase sigma factor [Novipirellula artificiosorum]|uniref:ECF RNA polymerase sigma factor SigR n=1 Tax=Novipirellula artificiosorum TaxID=2528016 RepID=A0A5C6DAI5_9BACT|nr:sigma-70 family RNA polymerase sigma factor [Novipirellula artificiosorum]TWU32834.1 ECF RNA polymerase sigma factor SigR [Novipirellula artificiosorum]